MITPFGDDSTTARNSRSVGATGGRGPGVGVWLDTVSMWFSGGVAVARVRIGLAIQAPPQTPDPPLRLRRRDAMPNP